MFLQGFCLGIVFSGVFAAVADVGGYRNGYKQAAKDFLADAKAWQIALLKARNRQDEEKLEADTK